MLPSHGGGGGGDGDEIILSYNDAVLRRSDLAILAGPHFINDRIIDFFFAHLAATFPSDELLLVPPALSFWAANAADPRDALLPLRLPARRLALFTVNDNPDVTAAEGGSHWSLLVYDRAAAAFVHHDSGGGINRRHAERLFAAVRGLVGDGGAARFVAGPTPQQDNGYDCGLYVMAAARAVCRWFAGGGAAGKERWFAKLEEEVDGGAVRDMRGELTRLILHLMNHNPKK